MPHKPNSLINTKNCQRGETKQGEKREEARWGDSEGEKKKKKSEEKKWESLL